MNRLTSLHIGIGCCLASAIGYTLSNALLRELSTSADQIVTIFVKESFTTVLVGFVLLVLISRGRFEWPGWRCVWILVFAGVVTQLGGNIPVLWSFSIIGMSIAMPIFLGMNLVGSAILGRLVLKEPVCMRTVCAIGLLVASVIVLNLGGSSAPDLPKIGWKMQVIGTATAVLGGLSFSVLTVSMRYVLINRTASEASTFWVVVFMIPAAGTYILGPLLWFQSGLEIFGEVAAHHAGLMLLAGVLNFLAFFLLSKGLRIVPVVLANITSTTQVAMGALLGIFVFHESVSIWFVAGLILAISGVILISSKGRE